MTGICDNKGGPAKGSRRMVFNGIAVIGVFVGKKVNLTGL